MVLTLRFYLCLCYQHEYELAQVRDLDSFQNTNLAMALEAGGEAYKLISHSLVHTELSQWQVIGSVPFLSLLKLWKKIPL